MMTQLLKSGHFSLASFSEAKSVTPQFLAGDSFIHLHWFVDMTEVDQAKTNFWVSMYYGIVY